MNHFSDPPVEYLRECSSTSLRYFEMSKLEHVANLRRELTVLLDEMMEESALALFARWMLEKRSIPQGASRNGNGGKSLESKRARSLLAQFVTGAVLPPDSRSSANGSAPKSRNDASPAGAGVGGSNGELPPNGESRQRGHLSAEGAPARADHRMGRRNGRGTRTGRRGSAETPQIP